MKHQRSRPDRLNKSPAYGISGWRWRDDTVELAARVGACSVLDYGAGKGTLAEALSDTLLTVYNYDPVTYPALPKPAGIVVCTDVLPFLDRVLIADVLDDIKRLAKKAVFFVVPCHPDYKRAPDVIIEEPNWWLQYLARRWPNNAWDIVECFNDIKKPATKDTKTPRLRFTGFC